MVPRNLVRVQQAMTYVGVDGCKVGWFYVRLDGGLPQVGVVGALQELLCNLPGESSVFVDIPIGLRDDTPAPRCCDTAARKLLGAKGSSVFPAPIRAIFAEPTHATATSKSRKLIGKGISQQTFAIVPKIREVDELLTSCGRSKGMVREVHPEVCFWGLNGGREMQHAKKTKDGYAERMALMREVLPQVADQVAEEALKKYRRKDVARDDIADALAALATAVAPENTIHTVPAAPERDSQGLPMEMVYSLKRTAQSTLNAELWAS